MGACYISEYVLIRAVIDRGGRVACSSGVHRAHILRKTFHVEMKGGDSAHTQKMKQIERSGRGGKQRQRALSMWSCTCAVAGVSVMSASRPFMPSRPNWSCPPLSFVPSISQPATAGILKPCPTSPYSRRPFSRPPCPSLPSPSPSPSLFWRLPARTLNRTLSGLQTCKSVHMRLLSSSLTLLKVRVRNSEFSCRKWAG